MIKLKGISKTYTVADGEVKALDDVSLTLPKTGLVLITGSNGCGKSTLLNIIGGLDIPTSGDIEIEGVDLKGVSNNNKALRLRAEKISYVFQASNLVSNMTVKQNIEVAGEVNSPAINDIIKKVGLSGLEDRYPDQLSLGQQQKACLARAIYKNSAIVLADEPTSALDPESRNEVSKLLKEMSEDKLVIVVSHLPEDFDFYDRHIVMDKGKIISDGVIEEITDMGKENNVVFKKKKAHTGLILKSGFRRIKKRPFTFAINLIMATVMIVSVLMGINAIFSFGEDAPYKYVINSTDSVVIRTQDYTTLGDCEYYKVYPTKYAWEDFDKRYMGNSVEGAVFDRNAVPLFNFAFINNLEGIKYTSVKALGNKKLLGKKAENNNEVVITKYFAEQMLYYPLLDCEQYVDYNDILQRGVITVNDTKLKIVGIVDEDLSEYETLKDAFYGDCSQYVDKTASAPESLVSKPYKKDEAGSKYVMLYDYIRTFGGFIFVADGFENYIIENTRNINKDATLNSFTVKNIDNANIRVYGNTSGAVMPFSSAIGGSYEEYVYGLDEEAIEKKFNERLQNYYEIKLHTHSQPQIKPRFGITRNETEEDFALPVTGIYVDLATVNNKDEYTALARDGAEKAVAFVNEENFRKISQITYSLNDYGEAFLNVSKENTKVIKSFMEKRYGEEDLEYRKENNYMWYSGRILIDMSTDNLMYTGLIMTIVGAIVFVLEMIFISYSILQHTRQNNQDSGILMSLGKSNASVMLYTLSDYLYVFIAMLVIGNIILLPLYAIINKAIIGANISVSILRYNWYTALISIGITAIVSAIALLIVKLVSIRKTPIDCLRNR